MTQRLNEFLREKSRQAEQPVGAIDWSARRDEYLTEVQRLYRQVQDWLAQPIEQGTVQVATRTRSITETHIGTYAVEDLVLIIGDEEVLFSPRGRNIVGASGRVDVSGEMGEVTLLLMRGPRWSLLVSRQPTMRMEPLDEVRFEELLRRVMRP